MSEPFVNSCSARYPCSAFAVPALLIPLPVSAGIFDLPRSQPALFNAPE